MGYEINPSLSFSSAAGSSVTAPFSVTGGGGASAANAQPTTALKPSNLALAFLVVAAALIAEWLFLKRN